MRFWKDARRLAAGVVAGFLGAFAMAPAAQAQDCDRACLSNHITAFAEALEARDPSRLPVTDDVRITENSRLVELGEGAWEIVTERLDFRHDYIDTAHQVAAAHLAYRDGDVPVLVTVVLRAEGDMLSGIETQVHRVTPDSPFQPNQLHTPVRGMDRAVPEGERMSREDMVAMALLYTEGLRIGNFTDAGVPFAPETYRVENGVITAGEGCGWGNCGMYEGRIMLHPEIIPSVVAVDEEYGTVLLWMNFGDTGSYGEDIALITYEAFKIWGDEIHAINAFFDFQASSTPRFWASEDPVARR
ncbi:hypothetical protein [Alteraurantiacibacter aquimixticola]|uniref:DUF8021 domain-containing protein n=1 Tax=Alteraurantiacibacter aquimixticola TaxID=2489173 RepID=A0A4T3F244_9SPHN|nr:hypothetical protein [Alteraurantiacibacter aquimixticola]TIX50647.1 hypothetical protein E5222_10340 [Alteraurantiacibacter aquimixticola]